MESKTIKDNSTCFKSPRTPSACFSLRPEEILRQSFRCFRCALTPEERFYANSQTSNATSVKSWESHDTAGPLQLTDVEFFHYPVSCHLPSVDRCVIVGLFQVLTGAGPLALSDFRILTLSSGR